jgi:magnesium-transporting ATPase (P-type)
MSTALLLGLMLVFEPKEKGIMQRPPRDPRKPLITFALAMRTGLVTLVTLLGAFWLFDWEMTRQGETVAEARTAVINVIVLVETLYLFNCRSLTRSAFSIGLFSNLWAVGGAVAMIGAQMLFTYLPLMNHLFHTAPISLESWLRIAGVAVTAFVVVEVEKWLRFRGKGEHVVPE